MSAPRKGRLTDTGCRLAGVFESHCRLLWREKLGYSNRLQSKGGKVILSATVWVSLGAPVGYREGKG